MRFAFKSFPCARRPKHNLESMRRVKPRERADFFRLPLESINRFGQRGLLAGAFST
jgi:hypothetical protein